MTREHPELPAPAEIAVREAIKEVEALPSSGLVLLALVSLNAAKADLAKYFDERGTDA